MFSRLLNRYWIVTADEKPVQIGMHKFNILGFSAVVRLKRKEDT